MRKAVIFVVISQLVYMFCLRYKLELDVKLGNESTVALIKCDAVNSGSNSTLLMELHDSG